MCELIIHHQQNLLSQIYVSINLCCNVIKFEDYLWNAVFCHNLFFIVSFQCTFENSTPQ